MAIAQEGGHWYTPDGQPMYTIIGANGNERATTLRDARKLSLYPSVTTILSVAAKPGLERWKIDQALMAALTLPQVEGESLDDFKRRAQEDAKQHAIDAAQEGTNVHTAIERALLGQEYDPAHEASVRAVMALLEREWPLETWRAEKSFVCDLGYGGKIDLHSDHVVIDFKTKEFGPDDKIIAYDEQIMQLDAYRHGLGLPGATMANIYISRSCPGEVRLLIHDEGNHFEMFTHLLKFWQLSKNYHPKGENHGNNQQDIRHEN